MKERPIIFQGWGVQAILEGRKTQTWRVVRPQPETPQGNIHVHGSNWIIENWPRCEREMNNFGRCRELKCPYQVDKLWVRESFAIVTKDGRVVTHGQRFKQSEVDYVIYRGDEQDKKKRMRRFGETTESRWRPAIHMPRWACRLTLEITEVRVQRLQDISEEDARAEGVWEIEVPGVVWEGDVPVAPRDTEATMKDRFKQAWDSINGKAFPWAKNPLVWAITFKRSES